MVPDLTSYVLGLELSQDEVPQFGDFEEMKVVIAKRFATKTREEWTKIFEKLDGCVEPVLELEEAADHPHNKDKGSFIREGSNDPEPGPAPRLSDSRGLPAAAPLPGHGQHSVEILKEHGYTDVEIQKYLDSRIIVQAERVNSKL